MKKSFLVIACGLIAASAFAGELPVRSDVGAILPHISNIKSQKGRNTCTVFALTAAMETLYSQESGGEHIDFSEEWLQYLAAGATASGGAKGSMVSINFSQVRRHGMSVEKAMPFTSGEWASKPKTKKVEKYCGELSGLEYTRCLYGKRSPRYIRYSDNQLRGLPGGEEFIQARELAESNRPFTDRLRTRQIGSGSVKAYLAKGIPLTLEINVHYGSWNHPRGNKFGIDVSGRMYGKGVVTYPERGSVDRYESDRNVARHAVQVIGYDDEIEVEYTKQMRDGSKQTFRRKGVYYIKNSWGKNFGRKFKIGRKRIPGLGMITQEYANDLGKFTAVSVVK